MAEGLAGLQNAAREVDSPHLPAVTAEYVRLKLRHGWDDRPVTHLFVSVTDGGEVVGSATLDLPTWDNQHVAEIDLETHPARRGGDGVDDRLLDRVLETVRPTGRALLLSDAWADSYRERFWHRHGFSVASRDAQRRLVTAELDWPRLHELHHDSLIVSGAYDIVDLGMPAPDELVPGLLELHRAMNDSPLDELELEDEIWTEERLRGYERAMTFRGIRLHRLLARRRADGELGGHTVVAVEEERPWIAFQEDTAVVGGHRGRRLGLRLKIEMLEHLAKLEPQIELIDTWNAASNSHMLAVNDAIGYVVMGQAVEVQKRLPTGQAQSWPSSRSSASSTVPS